MKITFLPFSKLNIAPHTSACSKDSIKIDSEKSMPVFYYMPLNFKGAIKIEDELKKLDNAHCPVCGIKTLSEEKYSEIIEESKNIKTPDDFLNLLKKNKEYIPVFYSKILKHTEASIKNPDVTSTDRLFQVLSKISKSRVKTYLKRASEDLTVIKQSGNFSKEDEEKLDICIQELSKPYRERMTQIPKFSHYLDVLFPNLLTMENTRKHDIYAAVRDKLKTAFLYSGLFMKNWNNGSTLTDETASQIVSRIFAPSLKKTGKIIDKLNNLSFEYVNTILICDGCAKNSKNTLNTIKKNPNASLYAETYLKELSDGIAKGEINLPASYPFLQAKNIRRLANINIDMHPIQKTLKNKFFEERHNEIDFEVLNHENVPCASCGITTLTHNQKVDIMTKIKNAAYEEELFSIVDENKKYIRPEFAELLEEYKYIYSKFPGFSQKEIIEILKQKMDLSINLLMLETVINVSQKADMLDLNKSDQKLLSQYINKTKVFFINKEFEMWFPYNDYNSLVENTLLKMENEKKFDLINIARGNIREKHIIETILYVHPNILQKMSPLKGMLQNMFKASVITADHIIPRDKKGGNEKTNIAAFCKLCNRKKTDMLLKDFYAFHPEVRKNMQKYLNRVIELIKTGELKGYEDYPAMFANKIKWLTRQNKKPIILRFQPIETDKKRQ